MISYHKNCFCFFIKIVCLLVILQPVTSLARYEIVVSSPKDLSNFRTNFFRTLLDFISNFMNNIPIVVVHDAVNAAINGAILGLTTGLYAEGPLGAVFGGAAGIVIGGIAGAILGAAGGVIKDYRDNLSKIYKSKNRSTSEKLYMNQMLPATQHQDINITM